jgi:hypothetical protein
MTKLLRSQKRKYSGKLNIDKVQSRFMVNDVVIVISGKYRNKISKFQKQIGQHCFLDESHKDKPCFNKAKHRNKIANLSIKVHESNLMHYDEKNQVRSKVKHYYKIVENNDTKKKNKIKVRIFKKTGLEQEMTFVKKSLLHKTSEEDSPNQTNMLDSTENSNTSQENSNQENKEESKSSDKTNSDQENKEESKSSDKTDKQENKKTDKK